MTKKKDKISGQIQGLKDQVKLLNMIHARAKLASQNMSAKEAKNLCGYDARLALNDDQFQEWLKSKEGQTAFATETLGPRTDETRAINQRVLAPGQPAPAVPETGEFSDICMNVARKCKHFNWREVHNQDFHESQQMLSNDLRKLQAQIDEIIDDAETREATKDYHANNVTIQLF